MVKPRIKEQYDSTVRLQLKKSLGLSNIMEVPKLNKVVLNVGAGRDAVTDSKMLNRVVDILGKISGQRAVKTLARKSIAGFKIREGMPLGAKVTLRGAKMYEFLDRLIHVALPTVRDFQGVSKGFDDNGNYNLGIKEWIIFPEVDIAEISNKIYGMNITIDTSAKSKEHAFELLKSLGMPFKKA